MIKNAFIGVLLFLLIIFAAGTACRGRSNYGPPQNAWSQGYEGTSGGYMQPDHGYMYYWFMYHVLFNNRVQPTYHVYNPPVGYPATYRPWQASPGVSTSTPSANPRTSGGFSAVPSAPARPLNSNPRTSGGFSPSPSSPRTVAPANPRTSGGFTPPPSTYRPSTPAPSPRTSGGFSKSYSSPSTSSPRSSGGFGKK